MEVASMSHSDRNGLSSTGPNPESNSRVTPREEPYLNPTFLDKPILQIYDGESGVDLDRVLLEEPDSCQAWIQTHKQALVDAEAHR